MLGRPGARLPGPQSAAREAQELSFAFCPVAREAPDPRENSGPNSGRIGRGGRLWD